MSAGKEGFAYTKSSEWPRPLIRMVFCSFCLHIFRLSEIPPAFYSATLLVTMRPLSGGLFQAPLPDKTARKICHAQFDLKDSKRINPDSIAPTTIEMCAPALVLCLF